MLWANHSVSMLSPGIVGVQCLLSFWVVVEPISRGRLGAGKWVRPQGPAKPQLWNVMALADMVTRAGERGQHLEAVADRFLGSSPA
jgi:hypothetical protein